MGTIEDGLFDYDLGFGEQQLIPNSQVITSSSQTPRDFLKQTPLNPVPCGMEVPPNKALDMSGSPHLTIGYLLRIGCGDLESQVGWLR